MMRFLPYLFITLFLLNACENGEDNLFSVSGKLVSNGIPLKYSTVDIDGLEQHKSKTDDLGNFHISNISKGSHTLNTKTKFGNDVYIQKSYDILLTDNLFFEALVLPNPVSITSIEMDSLTNIVTIIWSKSHDADFREYKLYSHINSGLDETTGSLEHVTTFADDTVFNIQVVGLKEMFFRVFVFDEYGQYGGSNIESVTGNNINILTGGDFEDVELFKDNWIISQGKVKITYTLAYEGASCLQMKNNPIPDNEVELSFIETPLLIEDDIEYELSFWYRVNGIAAVEHHQTLFFFYLQDEENKIETNLPWILGFEYWPGVWINGYYRELEDSGWLYYSKIFVSNSDSPASFYIGGRIENLMFDNLELKKTEL